MAAEICANKFPCKVASVEMPPKHTTSTPAAEPWQQSWLAALVAGLLSSSCCLLQLGLNLLSSLDLIHLGCAGFNKLLGPVRTPVRLVTLGVIGLLWPKPKHRSLSLAAQTLLTVALMTSPELLLMSDGPAVAPATADVVKLNLTLDGMGCEACSLHVQKLLESSSGVVSADVSFETGLVQLEVARDWGFDINSTQLRLLNDGYP